MASDVTGTVIARPKSLVRVVLGSATGTMIEWYDFYIFGIAHRRFSPSFYPPGNDTFALIAYLSTFAVGFLVRPFGALFFGRIGDLVGRRIAFLVTLVIMGGATAVDRRAADIQNRRHGRADRAARSSACCRGWRSAASTAARRSTWPSTCPIAGAASTPASSRSPRRWDLFSRSP